jgi:hypothetical protein
MRKRNKEQYIKDITENWRKHRSSEVYMSDMLSGHLGRIYKYHSKAFSYQLNMDFNFMSLGEAKQFAAEFAWFTWKFREKFHRKQDKQDLLESVNSLRKVRSHAR